MCAGQHSDTLASTAALCLHMLTTRPAQPAAAAANRVADIKLLPPLCWHVSQGAFEANDRLLRAVRLFEGQVKGAGEQQQRQNQAGGRSRRSSSSRVPSSSGSRGCGCGRRAELLAAVRKRQQQQVGCKAQTRKRPAALLSTRLAGSSQSGCAARSLQECRQQKQQQL